MGPIPTGAFDSYVKRGEIDMNDNFVSYTVVDDHVMVPRMDAMRIRYLLEKLVEYIADVGPRDLRGLEDDAVEFIAALPEYNSSV